MVFVGIPSIFIFHEVDILTYTLLLVAATMTKTSTYTVAPGDNVSALTYRFVTLLYRHESSELVALL